MSSGLECSLLERKGLIKLGRPLPEARLAAKIYQGNKILVKLPINCTGGPSAFLSCHLLSGELFGDSAAFEVTLLLYVTTSEHTALSSIHFFHLSSALGLGKRDVGLCNLRKSHTVWLHFFCKPRSAF